MTRETSGKTLGGLVAFSLVGEEAARCNRCRSGGGGPLLRSTDGSGKCGELPYQSTTVECKPRN
jgi:hypothetical protein